MSIPENITKEHIEKAIEEIEIIGIPKNRLSERYFFQIGDNEFPPKYTITIANKYANGKEWPSENFQAVEAEAFLKKLGFTIRDANGPGNSNSAKFYPELKKFLDQANTNNLTYGNYIKEYLGLKVRVSFGKGNIARIPWISFLANDQTTNNGIYPVYLYFKDFNELILAYGVSETNTPRLSWNLPNNTLSIRDYYKKLKKTPARYGESFIFKVYNLNQNLVPSQMNADLDDLIQRYKSMINNNVSSKSIQNPIKTINMDKLNLSQVFNDISKTGLVFNYPITKRFLSSLLTKSFVILTGLSGSGKTKLAQVFAKWICADENQYRLIPVGADWTNREPLLGYQNTLEPGKYVLPETGALVLILEAGKPENQNKPYFLILDEMNLSHVERYFADFLSAMESGEDIPLHSDTGDWQDEVPAKIKLPKNMFIVGTVNIDETTYMFSPKVLDRASVIEFRVTPGEMQAYLEAPKRIDVKSISGLGADMAASFVEMAGDKDVKPTDADSLNKVLIGFFNELKKVGAEFGYRSASEIYRFVAIANKLDPEWAMDEILDCAIMQKLLPKVHGSRRKLEPVLKTLGTICLADGKVIEDIFNRKEEIDFNDPQVSRFPISLEKIDRMYRGLLDNGFTSYAEA